MKLKYYISAAIVAATTLTITGCSDFLEPDSKSEFVPEDATSLNELLLGEAYQRNDMEGFSVFMELLNDDIEAAPYQTPIDGFDPNKYLAAYTWQPDMFDMMEEANSGHINMYERYYEVILGANAVIDYLPEVSDTELNINKVKAQAYALRAFYYFNLVNIFGQPYNHNPEALGVPLKLNSGIEESNDYLSRKTVTEVYTQILSDLHTAEAAYLEMPTANQWEDNNRTSLPMVQLMLSRTYLYMENWTEAARYAKLVMENSNFKLYDLNSMDYGYVDDNGTFIRNYVAYHTYSSPETIWPYGSIDDIFGWTFEYANSVNSLNNKKMHAYFQASESLLECFDDYDLRLGRYIVQASDGTSSGSLMYMAYGKVHIGTTYYFPTDALGYFGRSLRLSEAYLNYAEACAMLGGEMEQGAIDAINDLREKRFDPEDFEEYEPESNEALIEFIKEERRRELCFEGHRWFDLRRWGMPAITHIWHNNAESSSTYRLEQGDLQYTIPIPKEAMDMNGSLIQNDLADKRYPITEE